METLTLEKRVLEALQLDEGNPSQPAVPASAEARLAEQTAPSAATTGTAGTVTLAGEGTLPVESTPEVSRRHGYREDSPPEVIALLHQAQGGNTEAFAYLYRLYADQITRYAATRMRDEDRSAIPDVVQDAFCEAFAELGDAHHDVKGWLLAHAAKAYIRYVRADRKQRRAFRGVREVVRRAYAYGHVWDERPVRSGETDA